MLPLRKKAIEVVGADDYTSKRDGTLVFRKGFFYRNGCNSSNYANSVSKKLTEAGIPHVILDDYEIWKVFKGGASVKNQSHWGVVVKLIFI